MACTVALGVIGTRHLSGSDLVVTAYLALLAAVLARVWVPLPRGRLNLTAISTQTAAMLLPPQLAAFVGLSAVALGTAERAAPFRLPVRAAAYTFWSALGSAIHSAATSQGLTSWSADIGVVIANSMTNWVVVALAFSLFNREPVVEVLRRNLSAEWFYAFIAFGVASLLVAHLMRGGQPAGFVYATLVVVLAFALRSHVALGAIRPTLAASMQQVSEQSTYLGELEGALHDLRNVLMTANVVAADGIDEDLRPILAEALEVSRRHLGTSSAAIAFRDVDVRELLMRSSAIGRPVAGSKGVRFEVALPGEPMPVFGNGVLLVEVLTNVMLNAIHASQNGGRVHVGCSVRRSGLRVISVSDSGTGFGAGASLEATAYAAARRGPGHGIGLRWSQGIAAQHLGRLVLESSSRSGSIVSLQLPDPRAARRRLAALQPRT